MSVGLRDQRAMIYTYSDAGSDGLMRSRYTYSVERWCRFEIPSAREQTLAAKAGKVVDGVVAFADEVTISQDALLIIAGVQYKVTGVKPVRQQREILCSVVLGDIPLADLVES